MTTKDKLVALFQLLQKDFYNRRNSSIVEMTKKLIDLQQLLLTLSKNLQIDTKEATGYTREGAEKDFYKTFPTKKYFLYKIYNYEPSINYLQFRTIVSNLIENILRSNKKICWYEGEIDNFLTDIGNMYDDLSTIRKY